MEETNKPATGFKDLLSSMMKRRWYITALVLGSFILIIAGIFAAVSNNASMAGEWKELLMLLLGAFIGSYGKIIDYWFSDTDKDKMLVQKMDEEDGVSLGHTNDMKETNKPFAPLMPDAFVQAAERASAQTKSDHLMDHEMDKINTANAHEIHKMELEFEHQEHRQCEHEWADMNYDGELECQKCGKIQEHH